MSKSVPKQLEDCRRIIDKQQSELSALKRERAMLVEACEKYERGYISWADVLTVINATEPQATQWLELHDAEVLEAGADKINMLYPFSSELATQTECYQELRKMASELRLAASKREQKC